jgi:release factor glutamine methyltransferase
MGVAHVLESESFGYGEAAFDDAGAGARDALTVEVALRWGATRLSHIADRPRLEAERLLAAVLGAERVVLLTHPRVRIRPAPAQVYVDAVRRREQGVPLPYILGRVEFYGLELAVTPDVLIPRPETEALVDHAVEDLKSRVLLEQLPVVVDVGTGSGCIAIALAVTFAALHVIAIDIDATALAVARTNALRHGVEERVRCVRGDLLSAIAGPIDLILSNPPYIAEREWQDLPTSVRQEPRLALVAGPEGLAAIHRLLDQASSRLAPGGLLLLEIGSGQGNAVRALARTAFPGAAVEILPDLAGLDRLLVVRIH